MGNIHLMADPNHLDTKRMEFIGKCVILRHSCNLFWLISKCHKTSRQITLNYVSAEAAKIPVDHSFGQLGMTT
jgi:hypothetical protein